MRAPLYPPSRQTLRLKPGGLIVFPPRFLKCAGWCVGDTLVLSVTGGRMSIMRLPDERTWRIDRLRLRSGSTVSPSVSTGIIVTYRDYLALRNGQARIDSTHHRGT